MSEGSKRKAVDEIPPMKAFSQGMDASPILDALDNPEVKTNFMRMLGFEPAYDEDGRFTGWVETKEPSYKDQTLALLSLMAEKRSMAIAILEDVTPVSQLELETLIELAWDVHELLAPPGEDTSKYLPAYIWAKVELLKALSLANGGELVRSILGIPYVKRSEPSQLITAEDVQPEKKRGFFGRLFGGG